MGYRGKVEEQLRARELRAQGLALSVIAKELGVAKSSVSKWVRGVDLPPGAPEVVKARPRGEDHPLTKRRRRQEAVARQVAVERLSEMSEEQFLFSGLALYAGEGHKGRGSVGFTNTDPRLVAFFCRWLRRFFAVDESRLRAQLYLHRHLDLASATDFWSKVTEIPTSQFNKPYRADIDATRRHSRHVNGCITVRLGDAQMHRELTAMMDRVLELGSEQDRQLHH